jgi:putative transcriptional regulator
MLIKEVKNNRIRVGMSQIKMAKELGISRGHYNGIENGRYKPSMDLLEKIAEVSDRLLVITFIDKQDEGL